MKRALSLGPAVTVANGGNRMTDPAAGDAEGALRLQNPLYRIP